MRALRLALSPAFGGGGGDRGTLMEADLDLLIVTPCHNEAVNIPPLANTLRQQEALAELLWRWIVVDDGSSDATADAARRFGRGLPLTVISRRNSGGLLGGSAFGAWAAGVQHAADGKNLAAWTMKLDADVRLGAGYFGRVLSSAEGAQIAGGRLDDLANREQNQHVQGAVKMYSSDVLQQVLDLPKALGFDVMDEVLVRGLGGRVHVVADATYKVVRHTGASEGLLRGRRRNGVMCRWTGYSTLYFILHLLRYLTRRPFMVGAVAVLLGYVTADLGPYPVELKRRHVEEQTAKLRELARSPLRWLRATYGS